MSEKSPKGQVSSTSSPNVVTKTSPPSRSSRSSSSKKSPHPMQEELYYDGVEPFLNRLRDINFENIDEGTDQLVDNLQSSPTRSIPASDIQVSPSRFEVDLEELYAHARMLAMSADYGISQSPVESIASNKSIEQPGSIENIPVDDTPHNANHNPNNNAPYDIEYSTPDKSVYTTSNIQDYHTSFITSPPQKHHLRSPVADTPVQSSSNTNNRSQSQRSSPIMQVLLPTVEELLREVRERASIPRTDIYSRHMSNSNNNNNIYVDPTNTPEYLQLKIQYEASQEQAKKYQDVYTECQELKLQLSEYKEKVSEQTYLQRKKNSSEILETENQRIRTEQTDMVQRNKLQEQTAHDMHSENSQLRQDAGALAKRLRRKLTRVQEQEQRIENQTVHTTKKPEQDVLASSANVLLQIPFLQTAQVHNTMLNNCNTGHCGVCLVCTRLKVSESEKKVRKLKKMLKQQYQEPHTCSVPEEVIQQVQHLEDAVHQRDRVIEQQQTQITHAIAERDVAYQKWHEACAFKGSNSNNSSNGYSNSNHSNGYSHNHSNSNNHHNSNNNNHHHTNAPSTYMHGHIERAFVNLADYIANLHIQNPSTIRPIQVSISNQLHQQEKDTSKLQVTSIAESCSDVVGTLVNNVNDYNCHLQTLQEQTNLVTKEQQTQLEQLQKANTSLIHENTSCMSRLNNQGEQVRGQQRENAVLQHQAQQLRVQEREITRNTEKLQQQAIASARIAAPPTKTAVPHGYLDKATSKVQYHDENNNTTQESLLSDVSSQSSSSSSSSIPPPHRYMGLYNSKAISKMPTNMYRKNTSTKQ